MCKGNVLCKELLVQMELSGDSVVIFIGLFAPCVLLYDAVNCSIYLDLLFKSLPRFKNLMDLPLLGLGICDCHGILSGL